MNQLASVNVKWKNNAVMAKSLTQLPAAVNVNMCHNVQLVMSLILIHASAYVQEAYLQTYGMYDFENVGKIKKCSASSLVVVNVPATFIVKGRRLLIQVPANV